MLAVNHIEFLNVPLSTPEKLVALRNSGKLPFDQLPLLEIDNNHLGDRCKGLGEPN